jgi:hypothetical protein
VLGYFPTFHVIQECAEQIHTREGLQRSLFLPNVFTNARAFTGSLMPLRRTQEDENEAYYPEWKA